MADQRRRELERQAKQGDHEAAERLYWDDLALFGGPQLLDKLIETVLTLASGNQRRLPSVWDKIAFVRGEPSAELSGQQLGSLVERHRALATAEDLHRVPRVIRTVGFTTYVESERAVYRLNSDAQWERLATMSRQPPSHPFHVVDTLADRDALRLQHGRGSCLVMANGGVYDADGVNGPMTGNPNTSTCWRTIRIEKVSRRGT